MWLIKYMKILVFDSLFFQTVSLDFHLLIREIGMIVIHLNWLYTVLNTLYLDDNEKINFLKFWKKSMFFHIFQH